MLCFFLHVQTFLCGLFVGGSKIGQVTIMIAKLDKWQLW